MLAWIASDRCASEPANVVDVFKATQLVVDAWRKVSNDTIKNCVAKCGVVGQPAEGDSELNKEFIDRFKELTL